MADSWFSVDKEGLSQLLARRGPGFVLCELLQNVWDTDATRAVVTVAPVEGRPEVTIVVEDDDPEGFKDLTHAYTLFAPSLKKGDTRKRGRFNLGEKLVLALCRDATIVTTTGGVEFAADGTRRTLRRRLEKGSSFAAVVRMTRAEHAAMMEEVGRLIPPAHCVTTINGVELVARTPIMTIADCLDTETSDEAGVLRKVSRLTDVLVYEPLPGQPARLYEMGIPVVETGDRWDLDVQQKVPLNLERDNVTPSYLRQLRLLALNALYDKMTPADATSTWARDAAGHYEVSAQAVTRMLDLRYGEKRVIADPTDPEATKRAVAEGYTVIHGGSHSASEWERIRTHRVALPAGQVFPTHPEATVDAKVIPPHEWSTGMRDTALWAQLLSRELLHGGDMAARALRVVVIDNPTVSTVASYAKSPSYSRDGSVLTLNVGLLGMGWFDHKRDDPEVVKLLLHELAHELSSDHLSESYHDACCLLGARYGLLMKRLGYVVTTRGEDGLSDEVLRKGQA